MLIGLIKQHRQSFREDGEAAVRWVPERHDKVALVGFSAGGILAADLAGLEDPSGRPEAAALIYVPF